MQHAFYRTFVMVFALLVATCFLFPTEAKADPTYDCTAGCWVVTCAGVNCTLYRCDSSGCTAVSTFQKPLSEAKSMAGTLESPWNESAFVKVCPVNRACSLYKLSQGESSFLGSFDNIDSIIQGVSAESTQGESARINRGSLGKL